MSRNRKELARVAAAQAMKTRKQSQCSLHSPLNVFDLCERLGVSVLFQDIPSMEGIYMPDAQPRPAIIVSSLRPMGRKAMTCGHELGHHVFKHGRQWDELIEERSQSRRFDPDEFQADVFAACLQMPKTAVSHALANRMLDPEHCRAEDIFALSTYFGVSYGALVTHLERTLNLIGMKRASELAARKPQDLREALLGEPCPQNLTVVNLGWEERAVDVETGDTLLLSTDVVLEGDCAQVEAVSNCRTVISASRPGIARVSHSSGWSVFVRVMRKDYVGLAPFRFDEEADDDV
jgi:Zn-dependent peptidase ImmA (M78 family)